ncbi:hypothetical protein DES53_11541 [Roseimicrobium gellanilyticum]|uniref:Uncharacterized protein n=1 Tax=Roseimicrobium gellanilyticum TaxID=748857 RepID=A0A366H7D7_9BACT|nr:hypothetical protein [Roseimicrobium gellanilyticum]RBP36900.1 hypothetical protein DES53_11541 [Roseimicrobium gellanilyticum]
MKLCLFTVLLCVATAPGAEDHFTADDRRIMQYLKSLSDDDLGKKGRGVRLSDDKVVLEGHTLLHRLAVPSHRAHIYVLREGSLAMGMPEAYAWVEPGGKSFPIPDVPAGERGEAAYMQREVYTYADVVPGIGLVEISCPTERWIKSLLPPADAAKWGIESMATIEDPDGYSNVRDEKGDVIATVKAGEKFLAVKPFPASTHWEVWLPDGTTGLIHASRVRLLPQEPLMKMNFTPCVAHWKQAAAQREAEHRAAGLQPHPHDYYPTLLLASTGDIAALSRVFAGQFEDAAEADYQRNAWRVLHLAGDARMAEMLKAQPPQNNDDDNVGAMLTDEWTTAPISDGKKYLERHFPLTYAALFSK